MSPRQGGGSSPCPHPLAQVALATSPASGRGKKTLRRGQPFEFFLEQSVENVVLPATVDAQVLPGVALFGEAQLHEEPAAGCIVWQAGCLDPMQTETVEGIGHQGLQRLGHVAVSGK